MIKYEALNLHGMIGPIKNTLQVCRCVNKNSWMTATVFGKWFNRNSVLEVGIYKKKYTNDNNALKIL